MNHSDRETELAARMLQAQNQARLIDGELVPSPENVEQAQQRQFEINALRRARGEQLAGYKIGFTNRTIWPIYNVFQPIWAPVWNTTLTLLDSTETRCSLEKYTQPRLEPEIVFGMAASPASDDPDEIFDAIGWIAHGFEIVQSPYPDWKFTAAQAIAAQSLHGALIVGPRKPRAIVPTWQALGEIELSLSLDGEAIAHGNASLVLDNPVLALSHLVRQLADCGTRLQPGDVITTGTLTDAQPLTVGQTWRTQLTGAPLDGLQLVTQ